MNSIRLNRYLASAGIASRRNAEELILAGRVAINGAVATLTTPVMSEDTVTLDGNPVVPELEKVYFLLNKPRGVVCSTKGDRRVIDLLQDVPYRLFTAGRLDKETEGLILVTNDGEFADNVIHPSRNLEKEYVAKADQEITDAHLKIISQGTLVEGVMVSPIRVEKVRKGTLKIVISEGKKREVRHLLEAAGLETIALKRVRLGSLVLGDLKVGAYRPLREDEIARLLSGSNESEAIPEASLEFEEVADHQFAENGPRHEVADSRAPRFGGERRPYQERSFSPRDGGERGFAGRGRPQGGRPPFRREEGGPRRFGEDRMPRQDSETGEPSENKEHAQGERGSREGGQFPRAFSPRSRDFSDRPRQSPFASRQRDSDSSERAPRGDRREGGFSDRPRWNDRKEGGFSDRPPREGGFRPREGGDRPPREGGFRPREGGFRPREGGFSDRPREGGFRPREGGFRPREGGFSDRPPREGGFRPREGGFRPREGGFSDRPREGGFRPREGGFRPREGGFAPRDGERKFSPRPPRDGEKRFSRDDRPRFSREGEGQGRGFSREGSRFPQHRDRPPFEKPPFRPTEDA